MINSKDNQTLSILNHSCAHLLAQAVKRLYPKALFWVGPAISEGFYYDIDLGEESIKEEDLVTIEREMKKISKDGKRIYREEISKEEALKRFQDDPYKMELLNAIDDTTVISCYTQGEFTDLCRGPHVESVKQLKHFKLLKVSGAFFKGDVNNKMLQRIYGICFETKEELEEYLKLLEEAKQRDHRKIGKELDLFCFSDLVGAGLPMFTPRGTIIKEELQKEVERICKENGFQKVFNPHLASIKLYEISGHAAKFSDELFHVSSSKGHDMVLKPVLCPHHTQLYASKTRSYRDLPIRYMESEKQYRAELPGAVSGLSRVYAITIEDGHCFCRVDQVKEEMIRIVNIIKDFYSRFNLWDSKWVSLSLRDPLTPEKYIGSDQDWEICEKMLEEVSNQLGLEAIRCEGEAALYGPKLDFMFKDAMGREIQIPTVQLDFATPKRFELVYINKDGGKTNPVMVHRAILGSYERFMMLLIEHFAGALPLWLSPVQVNIVPVNDLYHIDYCYQIKERLAKEDIRVEVDDHKQKLNYKIRQSNLYKNPYTLIIGDKEKENNTISYRLLGSKDTITLSIEQFLLKVKNEINNRVIELS